MMVSDEETGTGKGTTRVRRWKTSRGISIFFDNKSREGIGDVATKLSDENTLRTFLLDHMYGYKYPGGFTPLITG